MPLTVCLIAEKLNRLPFTAYTLYFIFLDHWYFFFSPRDLPHQYISEFSVFCFYLGWGEEEVKTTGQEKRAGEQVTFLVSIFFSQTATTALLMASSLTWKIYLEFITASRTVLLNSKMRKLHLLLSRNAHQHQEWVDLAILLKGTGRDECVWFPQSTLHFKISLWFSVQR